MVPAPHASVRAVLGPTLCQPAVAKRFLARFFVSFPPFFRASDAKTAERPETNSEKTTVNGRETAAGHASVGALLRRDVAAVHSRRLHRHADEYPVSQTTAQLIIYRFIRIFASQSL